MNIYKINFPITMKKLIVIYALVLGAMLMPTNALAQETEITCTSVYGGGVVCGAKTHEPINAGLGDINPAFLGGALLVTSGALLYLSKKIRAGASIAK